MAVLGLLGGACSDAESRPATSTTTTALPLSATTMLVVSPSDVLLEVITSSEFTASVDIEGRLEFRHAGTPLGEILQTGRGRFVGEDSEVLVRYDTSGLAEEAALPVNYPMNEEVRLVDGSLFARRNDSGWLQESGENTTLGHVIERLKQAGDLAELVSEVPATLLFGVEGVELDPVYFGIPASIEDFESTIVITTTAEGDPLEITVMASWTQPTPTPTEAEYTATYSLHDVGSPIEISVPEELQQLFTSSRYSYTLEIPADWEVEESDDEFEDFDLFLGDDEVVLIGIDRSSERPQTIAAATDPTIELLINTLGAEAVGEITDHEFGGMPASLIRYHATDDDVNNFWMIATAVTPDMVVLASWLSTAGDEETDEQRFLDILASFTLVATLTAPRPPGTPSVWKIEVGPYFTVIFGDTTDPQDTYGYLALGYLSALESQSVLIGTPEEDLIGMARSVCDLVSDQPTLQAQTAAVEDFLEGAPDEVTFAVGVGMATYCSWLMPAWYRAGSGASS